MRRLPKKLVVVGGLPLLTLFFGCGDGGSPPATASSHTGAKVEYAKATLRPMAGSKASGTVVFVKKPQGYALTLDAKGLEPTRGSRQYALWQLEDSGDRVALKVAEELVMLATYRVGGSGRLAVEFEPPVRAYQAVPNGRLTYFLITRIDSPESLQESIVEFDETGRSPDLGAPIAEGTLSGPLVGAAERR